MDIKQAEALKLQILERRNYLKEIEPSLTYSKGSLYGGMQNRIRRKSDRAFKKIVVKQQDLVTQKLRVVNDYIKGLSSYNTSLNSISSTNGITTQSVSIAPTPPKITLPLIPNGGKARMVRRIARGIRNGGFI